MVAMCSEACCHASASLMPNRAIAATAPSCISSGNFPMVKSMCGVVWLCWLTSRSSAAKPAAVQPAWKLGKTGRGLTAAARVRHRGPAGAHPSQRRGRAGDRAAAERSASGARAAERRAKGPRRPGEPPPEPPENPRPNLHPPRAPPLDGNAGPRKGTGRWNRKRSRSQEPGPVPGRGPDASRMPTPGLSEGWRPGPQARGPVTLLRGTRRSLARIDHRSRHGGAVHPLTLLVRLASPRSGPPA